MSFLVDINIDRSLSKQFSVSLAVGTVGFVVQYLFSIYVARLLGPAAYGDFSIALYFASLCGFAINLGSPLILNKFYSDYKLKGDLASLYGYFSFFGLRIPAIAGLLIASFLIIFFSLNCFLSGKNFSSIHPIYMAMILSPLLSFQELILTYYSCSGNPVWAVLIKRIFSSFFPLLIVIIISLFFHNLTSSHILLAYIISFFCISFVTYMLFERVTKICFKGVKAQIHGKKWLSASSGILLVYLIPVAVSQVSLMMVEYLGSNEKGVGIYAAAISIASIYLVLNHSFSYVLNPLVAQSFVDKNLSFKRLYLFSIIFILLVIVVLGSLIILFAGSLMDAFGPGFSGSSFLLIIVILSRSIEFLSTPAKSYLMFSDKKRYISGCYIFSLILIIVLNYLLIPIYQELGSALSLLLTSFVTFCLMNIFCFFGVKSS